MLAYVGRESEMAEGRGQDARAYDDPASSVPPNYNFGINGSGRFEFVLGAIAQNLRRLAKLVTKPSPLLVAA